MYFCWQLPPVPEPSNKTEILAEKIQYDVPVVNNDPQLDWWINNIEGSKREPFLKRIMEAAEKGEVRVYDYFNHPLTPQQLPAHVHRYYLQDPGPGISSL